MNRDVPLRLHAPEIGPHVTLQAFFRIEDARLSALAREDDPVPERFALLEMPLDRQQGQVGQAVPVAKRLFSGRGSHAEAAEQLADMRGAGPQAPVACMDAER